MVTVKKIACNNFHLSHKPGDLPGGSTLSLVIKIEFYLNFIFMI